MAVDEHGWWRNMSGWRERLADPSQGDVTKPGESGEVGSVVVCESYEPDRTSQAAGPAPIEVLHGTLRLEPRALSWQLTDPTEAASATFRRGGRVLIRVHCGHLFDVEKRVLSAATDALTGVATPHLPGGVFESWFFVTA